MSLSRKLYFPKSLSFGAIRWSFLALASFIKRNSRRSIHSFSSCSPWASLHSSSSVHELLRNLRETQKVKRSTVAESTGLRTGDVREVPTSRKLWRCPWGSGTASSSDRPRSWRLGLCASPTWCAAAIASRCCSSSHTASSGFPPAEKNTKTITFTRMTDDRPFIHLKLRL